MRPLPGPRGKQARMQEPCSTFQCHAKQLFSVTRGPAGLLIHKELEEKEALSAISGIESAGAGNWGETIQLVPNIFKSPPMLWL